MFSIFNIIDAIIKRIGVVAKKSRRFRRWQIREMPADSAGIQSFVSLNSQTRFAFPVVIVIVLPILWFLATEISQFFFRQSVYQDASFYNLTSENVSWDVYYGTSPLCGQVECHLTKDYPQAKFSKKMVLPAREFPLNDFKLGQKIYIRTAVKIPAAVLKSPEPIAFHSLYVWAESYRFYVNSSLLDEGSSELLNITIPRSMIPEDGVIQLAMMIDPGGLPYQGLANRRDLLIGPKSGLKKTAYDAEGLKTTFYLWFLLPKLTFCLVFSLIYLFMSRTRALMSFLFFTFLSSLDIFLNSGYAQSLLPEGVNWAFYGVLCRHFGYLAILAFLNEFFRRRSKHFYRWLGLGAAILALMPFLTLPLGYKTVMTLLDAIQGITYPGTFLFGLYVALMTTAHLAATKVSDRRARMSLFLATFFALSLLPALANSWQLITDLFDLNLHLGVNLNWIQDLILFIVLTTLTIMDVGYALTAKQQVEKELQDIEERMDLAKSVQELLLPAERNGSFSRFDFDFFYEPADKMSGDWMNIWDVGSDEKRLFFGDVVGKGPQAALAASAVACVIAECKHEQTTMEACIDRINTRLLDLFKGKINTTLMAIRLTDTGEAELFSCGAIGWFVKGPEKVSFIPIVGDPLGSKKNIKIGQKVVPMTDGMTAIAFTDGCLEGARALKALVKNLQSWPSDVAFVDIRDTVISTGSFSVRPDDRTILMVRAG